MEATLSEYDFAGAFRHSLDAKGRLTMPSKWRAQGDEASVYLALPNPHEQAIMVYPPAMRQKIREDAARIPISDAAGRRAMQAFFAQCDNFQLDASGRLKVAPHLLQYAGIEKEAVLAGSGNFFNIYEPGYYDAHYKEFNPSSVMEALSRLNL